MLAVLPTATSSNIASNAATTATIATIIPIPLLMGGSNENTSSNIWYSPFHAKYNTTTTTTTIPTATTTTTSVLAATKTDNISAIIGTNVSAHITPAISHVLLAPKTTTSTLATLAANVAPPTTMLSQDLVSSAGMVYNTTALAGAGSEEKINKFYIYQEQFVILWILFVIIVLVNSAVLFVMIINKNRKSRMNYFIKQLALADLCVGLMNVLTDIIQHMTIVWRAGNIACKLIRFSQQWVTYSSTYVLVAMSIDRYDAITHPMNFSKSWKRARYLVAWAWILGAIFSLPALVLYKEEEIEGLNQCWIELGSSTKWQIYFSWVAASIFAFPTIIISACYAVIVKTIWSKGSIFVPTERSGYSNAATRRASSRGIIPRAKIKTVKMTLVIVFAFIVCWLPYFAWDTLEVFGYIERTQTTVAIATLIQSLAPLNSAANPIIYCIFSSQVFRTLSRFAPFKWFTCCCKSFRNNSQQNRCHTVGRRLHNSASDSMRTLTTSLTVSRRSNKTTSRVVICERPKTALPLSDV